MKCFQETHLTSFLVNSKFLTQLTELVAKALDRGRVGCSALSDEVGEMLSYNIEQVVWFKVCVLNNILLDEVTKEMVLFVGPAGHVV
jgi:hypothetical protein